VLVTVVILSAVLPTLVAQRFFSPQTGRAATELVRLAELVGSEEDLGDEPLPEVGTELPQAKSVR
jgi:hypothetical protein